MRSCKYAQNGHKVCSLEASGTAKETALYRGSMNQHTGLFSGFYGAFQAQPLTREIIRIE
jgi:hypothetical protein